MSTPFSSPQSCKPVTAIPVALLASHALNEPLPIKGARASVASGVTSLAEFERLRAKRSDQIERALEPIVRQLQNDLDQLAGTSFLTFEENKQLARGIQALLNLLHLRVKCNGCGQPATLRCSKVTGSRNGSFQFSHSTGTRKTNHCGSGVLPRLVIERIKTSDDRLLRSA